MSPYSPARPCNQAGCPALVRGASRCADHAIKYQRPSRHSVGLDNDWLRLVEKKKREQPWCSHCGTDGSEPNNPLTGDHIVPRHLGGTNDRANVRVLCKRCNSRLAGGFRVFPPSQQFAIRERDLSQRSRSVVVHLVGAPASGKSYLRYQFDSRLGIPTFGIDDERERQLMPGQRWAEADSLAAWCRLEDLVDSYSPCGVETTGRHGNDRILLQGRQVYRVLCTASRETRRQRLEQRVLDHYRLAYNQSDYVDRLLDMVPSIKADAEWASDKEQDIGPIIQTIESWLVKAMQHAQL